MYERNWGMNEIVLLGYDRTARVRNVPLIDRRILFHRGRPVSQQGADVRACERTGDGVLQHSIERDDAGTTPHIEPSVVLTLGAPRLRLVRPE